MEMNQDVDPLETGEWLDALRAVHQHRGPERASFLVERVLQEARRQGGYVPATLTTAYCNTIPPEREEKSPGNRDIEHKIRSVIRWNAVAIIRPPRCSTTSASATSGTLPPSSTAAT